MKGAAMLMPWIILAVTTLDARETSSHVFSHARFIEGDKALDQRVRFPKVDGDIEVSVVCRGHATAKGRLRDTLCSSSNDPGRDFVNAVRRRVNSARLIPAEVDGVPQDVDFQFTIRFRKTGDTESVSAYLNNGHNAEQLGLDYVGAQRYSPHVWPGACNRWRDTEVVVEAATIDKDGRPIEVNAMATRSRMLEDCREALVRQLEAGRWIPASKDGQFIDAVWMSPIMLNMQDIVF